MISLWIGFPIDLDTWRGVFFGLSRTQIPALATPCRPVLPNHAYLSADPIRIAGFDVAACSAPAKPEQAPEPVARSAFESRGADRD
jgi:hypothetical protein